MEPSHASSLLVLLTQVLITAAAPQGGRRTLFSEPIKDVPGPEKNFTGIRVNSNSKQMVYYHEQTIAVVELGIERSLLNCELLEVKTARDRVSALSSLGWIKKKTKIAFSDMLDLQSQCEKLPGPQNAVANIIPGNTKRQQTAPPSFSTIFLGIFPGTKWCGRGDLAENYFDLGEEAAADKCCRTHDLCPVKVSAMKTQYNITNYSMVTKSHCSCDEAFLNCLKRSRSPLTDLIGSLYFNVGDPQCVDEIVPSKNPANNNKVAGKRFRSNTLRY